MKIRRFVTPDVRAAIRRVREELGPEAVILSNRRTAQGVEMMAAVEYEVPRGDASSRGRIPASRASTGSPPTTPGLHRYLEAAEASTGNQPSLSTLNHEIRSLRGMLEHQLANLTWSELERRHPVRSLVIRQLMCLGLSRSVAGQIAEAVAEDVEPRVAWNEALGALSQRIPIKAETLIRDGGVVALLGPTGVGKTTTVAKLAARFAISHGAEQVALITTDSYRIGAHEQLRAFGSTIDIPVQVANDEQGLRLALDRFDDRRLVLIDTAGMSQRDVRFSEQIKFIATGSPVAQNFLVLSATSQLHSLHEALRAFAGSHVDGCVITKIDECTSLGTVLCAVIGYATPVAYLSNGQRVPEDLRPAEAGRLVDLALEIARAYADAEEPPRVVSAGLQRERGA